MHVSKAVCPYPNPFLMDRLALFNTSNVNFRTKTNLQTVDFDDSGIQRMIFLYIYVDEIASEKKTSNINGQVERVYHDRRSKDRSEYRG